MAKKICSNKVIPKYVPDDLLWYERDSLMTYTDQLKYKHFKENRDDHLQNLEVANFDLINQRCRGMSLTN